MGSSGSKYKRSAPSEQDRAIIHCRALQQARIARLLDLDEDTLRLPNSTPIAHWALQVGDYFYEIAEPMETVFQRWIDSLDIDTLNRVAISQGVQSSLSSDDDEKARKRLESQVVKKLIQKNGEDIFSAYDDALFASDEKPTVLCRSKPKKAQGEREEGEIPLLMSRGAGWEGLSKSNHSRTMMCRLDIPHETVKRRATQIYKRVFQQGYKALSYNCHAFVLYLLFALRMSVGERVVYSPELLADYKANSGHWPFEERPTDDQHKGASLIIYRMWKEVVGDDVSNFPVKWGIPSEIWREWKINEDEIDYVNIVPPGLMAETTEVGPGDNHRQPPDRPRIHTEQPRSHAAHRLNEAHRMDLLNTQNVINNAVLTQQIQQTKHNKTPRHEPKRHVAPRHVQSSHARTHDRTHMKDGSHQGSFLSNFIASNPGILTPMPR